MQPIKELVSDIVYRDVLSVTEEDLPWEKLNNKTILITGANGFISYYMVLACLLRNDLYGADIRVIGLVRDMEKASGKYGRVCEREDFRFLVQDVCEKIDLNAAGWEEETWKNADVLIHAASQASAWHFENDPVGTISANLTGTQQVLELARISNAEVLFISSLKVYGSFAENKEAFLEEEIGYLDPDIYKNCYAMGKRTAETLCASYQKQYGVPVRIVRPSYIFGPTTMHDDRVWAQFLANAIRGESILLKSSGAPYRSFCYVTDTVCAIFTVLLRGEIMQPYNIADELGNASIRQLARTAMSIYPEKQLTLSFANPSDEAEPDPMKSPREILDSTKLRALGWKARVSLADGMKRAADIMTEQYDEREQ